jgi:hypothetical protein
MTPLGCRREEAKGPPVEVLPAASPISVRFLEFTGEGERGLKVLLYNSGDKPAAAYQFLFRYYDANDKLLRIKPGTPFEDDHVDVGQPLQVRAQEGRDDRDRWDAR